MRKIKINLAKIQHDVNLEKQKTIFQPNLQFLMMCEMPRVEVYEETIHLRKNI